MRFFIALWLNMNHRLPLYLTKPIWWALSGAIWSLNRDANGAVVTLAGSHKQQSTCKKNNRVQSSKCSEQQQKSCLCFTSADVIRFLNVDESRRDRVLKKTVGITLKECRHWTRPQICCWAWGQRSNGDSLLQLDWARPLSEKATSLEGQEKQKR